MTPNEAWQDIERIPIDPSEIRLFEREIQFSTLAFGIVRETAGWTCVCASLMPASGTWDRNHAILAGHAVRLFKLIRSLLEQVVQDRAELAWVVLRMAAECAFNFRYLVTNASPELFDSFVTHSLRHEWDLLSELERNTLARGTTLPIELRMRRSILRTFEMSGINPKDKPAKHARDWGGKNLRERARSMGLDGAYRAVFSGPSRNVHGGWRDLLQHHIDCHGKGQYVPNFKVAKMRRPQPLLAISKITVPALASFLLSLKAKELLPALDSLQDLDERIETLDSLHEEFLAARQAAKESPVTPAPG
jgi:Family of unknown function (DUF5677)